MNIKSSKSIIDTILLTGVAFGISIAYASTSGIYATDDVSCLEGLQNQANPNACSVGTVNGTIVTNSISTKKKCFERSPGFPYCDVEEIDCTYKCLIDSRVYTNHLRVMSEFATPIPPRNSME